MIDEPRFKKYTERKFGTYFLFSTLNIGNELEQKKGRYVKKTKIVFYLQSKLREKGNQDDKRR